MDAERRFKSHTYRRHHRHGQRRWCGTCCEGQWQSRAGTPPSSSSRPWAREAPSLRPPSPPRIRPLLPPPPPSRHHRGRGGAAKVSSYRSRRRTCRCSLRCSLRPHYDSSHGCTLAPCFECTRLFLRLLTCCFRTRAQAAAGSATDSMNDIARVGVGVESALHT